MPPHMTYDTGAPGGGGLGGVREVIISWEIFVFKEGGGLFLWEI